MTDFTIGSEARCSDGDCGTVSRVIVDPVAKTVTHLVVTPRFGPGRLVPLDLVEPGTDEVRLRCTEAQFDALDAAEETRFLEGADGHAGYGAEEALYWPYYSIGMGGVAIGDTGLAPLADLPADHDAGRGPRPVRSASAGVSRSRQPTARSARSRASSSTRAATG